MMLGELLGKNDENTDRGVDPSGEQPCIRDADTFLRLQAERAEAPIRVPFEYKTKAVGVLQFEYREGSIHLVSPLFNPRDDKRMSWRNADDLKVTRMASDPSGQAVFHVRLGIDAKFRVVIDEENGGIMSLKSITEFNLGKGKEKGAESESGSIRAWLRNALGGLLG